MRRYQAEAWRTLAGLPRPSGPSPRKPAQELQPYSAGLSAGRVAGPGTGEQHSPCTPAAAWTTGTRWGRLELAKTAACPQAGFLTGSLVSQKPGCKAQAAALPNLGSLSDYFESWSSLAFCRIWQTSVMG